MFRLTSLVTTDFGQFWLFHYSLLPEAARSLNVSRVSVIHARTVQTSGVPELARAVQRGQLPVSTAAEVVQH